MSLQQRPSSRIDKLWRGEVTLNVTLFAGISSILLVVLYAYYTQVKRARDADEIFLESNLRVETALSRGRCGLWDFDFAPPRILLVPLDVRDARPSRLGRQYMSLPATLRG